MGNDGGVIANKRYLIATRDPEWKKRKDERAMTEGAVAAALSICAMSSTPLALPIVCDEFGNLLNKEAVIRHVLAVSGASDERPHPDFSHITSIRRNTIEVKPTFRPEEKESATNSLSAKQEEDFLFVCPVTGLEGNGKHPFLVIRVCGCLVSERAVRHVVDKSGSAACPSCGAAYPEDKTSIGSVVGHEIKVFQTTEEKEETTEKLSAYGEIRKRKRAAKKALSKANTEPVSKVSGTKRSLEKTDSEKETKQRNVTKA